MNFPFIDIHSHLLPGVDDGCPSLDDSLACVRQLIAAGFVGTICTPHYWLEMYARNTPREIQRRVEQLSEQIDAAGLRYALWPGAEVRIAPSTISWFEEHGVPVLAGSRYVLIDYWGNTWPDYGHAVIEYLRQNNYRPILAHPERMGLEGDELEAVRVELAEMGVIFQGNLNSLAGGEGRRAQVRMERWLDDDRYHIIATDMHGPMGLVARLGAIELLRRRAGAEQTGRLLGETPAAIVQPSS
jgi:protein-tyrosine phosphatase